MKHGWKSARSSNTDPQRNPVCRLMRTALLILTGCLFGGTHAAEDVRLNELVQSGDFEAALQHLDKVAADSETPAERKNGIDLDRGNVLAAQARSVRRRDVRDELLQAAQAAYQQFLNDRAADDRASVAQMKIAEIGLQQARHIVWDLEDADDSERQQQITAARKMFDESRRLFVVARNAFRKQLDTIPFVNEDEDPEGWERRRLIEARYLKAWLSDSICLYDRALTWDPDATPRNQHLEDAIEQFNDIIRFGQPAAALHARLMLGKCWQDRGDITKALGYFDQVRNQSSGNVYVYTAEYCRLICFNHESRTDYALVVNEATRWLDQHHDVRNTEAGLGILYERATATEALARQGDLKDSDRTIQLRQALADFETAGVVLSPVQHAARVAADRLRAEVGESRREPRDFDTAFDRGREITGKLQQARKAVTALTSEEQRQAARQQLDALTSEAGRLFRLALMLKESESDRKAVAQARYLLSYVYLQQRKYYDAVILARHVMRDHHEDAPETAADATEMAVSAAIQAWSDAPAADRDFELKLARDICAEVVRTFPKSRFSTAARMRLGRIYLDMREPALAAEVFQQVSQEDQGYAAARIEAGQAWWLAWAQASTAEPVDDATRRQWKQQARDLLTDGIQLQRKASTDDQLNDLVVRAEVSLSGILNQEGEFSETIRRLTESRPTVLDALSVQGERPEQGVRSAAFVGLCYRTLLRAYVGTRDIDQALGLMQKLEQLETGTAGSVYTQLGRELQRELQRLQDSGDNDRLQSVRESYKQFLSQVFETRNASNVGALLWIGESYAGLAEDAADSDASESLLRASTVYNELLQSDLEKPVKLAVRLRLIRIRRQQEKFADAVQLATQILSDNPSAVTVQIEAAHALSDWGEHGEPPRLLEAINGQTKEHKGPVWGWAMLARRLQTAEKENPSQFRPLFLEARYELSHSRIRYARQQPEAAEKQLQAAAQEVTLFTRLNPNIDPAWWQKFEDLNRTIQQELGRPATTLAGTGEATEDSDSALTPDSGNGKPPRSVQTSSTEPSLGVLLGGIGVIAVVVVFLSFVLMSRPKRKRHGVREQPDTFRLPGGKVASTAAGKTRSSPRQGKKTSGEEAVKGPRRRPAAGDASVKKKPRPS